MDQINLLFTFDRNFIQQFLCAFRSLIFYHQHTPLDVYILFNDKDKNSLHENNINFLNLRKCNIYENKIPYQLLLSIHPKIIEMINKLNDTPPTTIFVENNNFHVRNIKENVYYWL